MSAGLSRLFNDLGSNPVEADAREASKRLFAGLLGAATAYAAHPERYGRGEFNALARAAWDDQRQQPYSFRRIEPDRLAA